MKACAVCERASVRARLRQPPLAPESSVPSPSDRRRHDESCGTPRDRRTWGILCRVFHKIQQQGERAFVRGSRISNEVSFRIRDLDTVRSAEGTGSSGQKRHAMGLRDAGAKDSSCGDSPFHSLSPTAGGWIVFVLPPETLLHLQSGYVCDKWRLGR
jgi:hypothetical protein